MGTKVKYAPSIFDGQDDTECFASKYEERSENCGKGYINRHEVFFGRNRNNSKKYGCWVNLCQACHEIVHFGKDPTLKDKLKQECEERFVELHSQEEFDRIFRPHNDYQR